MEAFVFLYLPLFFTSLITIGANNIPDTSPGLNITTVCTTEEFQCPSGKCISDYYVCDDFDDCWGGEDERNCPEIKRVCTTEEFQCASGNCIPDYYVCNGLQDCWGGDDEINCPDTVCTTEEFQCSSGNCIPDYYVCDGLHDCWGGEEERNCTGCSTEQLYQCPNGPCIPRSWLCDGFKDCDGYEDETNCTATTAPDLTSTTTVATSMISNHGSGYQRFWPFWPHRPQVCRDKSLRCPTQLQYCHTNTWVQGRCQRSCGFCHSWK